MIEERLAAELQKRALDREREKREVQRICAESEELRDLKQKLMTAYINKERTAQIQEIQSRREEDVYREAMIEKNMLKTAENQLKVQAQIEERKRQDRLKSKEVLQKQMVEREQLRAEAYTEYVKEKAQVDALVERMIQEDEAVYISQQEKKKQAIKDMEESFRLRHELKQRELEIELKQLEELKKYEEARERREKELIIMKAKREEARNEIFIKLEAEEQKRRAEQEYIEKLRTDLYYEEFEYNERMKEQQKREKELQVREELMAANDYQKRLKEQKKNEDLQMEKTFKEQMMKKFAEDDRIEQMNAQKRRMKELEHRRQADALWQQKNELLRKQRELEEMEERKIKEDEDRKKEIVERERQRMLQELAPHVADYLPKGTLRSNDEKSYTIRKK